MKIVQLVTRNCAGGVQVVAESLDRSFRDNGNDAAVWFFCDTDEHLTPPAGAKFILRNRSSPFYYPRLLWRLFWMLLREKPDVILAHTTNTAVPGLLLAALAGIGKRVAVQHNPLNTYSSLARKTDEACADRGIYWRNVVVAETVRKTTDTYSLRAVSRLRLIHNGIKTPSPGSSQSADRLALRRGFSLPEDSPLVTAIGRLADQKNQAVLVDMVQPLKGVALALAGDGPLREGLEHQIAAAGLSADVHMLGLLSPEEVRQLLQTTDVFVTSSHFEAMPMVVLEAMQEGAVILASDIEAHRELLGDAGLLAPATAQNFRTELQRLLADPDLRATLSTKAVQRAALFSEEAMVRAYLFLIEEPLVEMSADL